MAEGINVVVATDEGTWMRKLRSNIGFAWVRSDAAVDNLTRYARCFGGIQGPLLYLLSPTQQFKGRLVEATVPGTDVKLQLRVGTSDISVFNGMFCWQEYGWDFENPPRTIVDAGGYTGISAVYFAIRFPDARIIAIEPSESNFRLLVRNTARFKNIQPVHAALWPRSGSLVLNDPGSGAWGLQVGEANPEGASGQTGESKHPVRAITVTDIIRDYGLDRIDLLKVDIEGSEREVFGDSVGWIDQVDAICMELHDRFKTGCSRSFFKAVDDFPVEFWRGENVLVMRQRPLLNSSEVSASEAGAPR
jgi:FkbM family methyltransferase